MSTQDENPLERIGPDDYRNDTELDEPALAAEQRGLANQIAALISVGGAERDVSTAVALLTARRSTRDDHVGLAPLAPAPAAGSAGVFAADGELLVATSPAGSSLDGVDRLLSAQGFRREQPLTVRQDGTDRDAFGGQVRRFAPTAAARPFAQTGDAAVALATQLSDAARTVEAYGLQVAPNHVTVLAAVMKGDGSPEPTAVRRSYPTAMARRLADQHPAQVAVIDTGIAATRRSDGWLADLEPTPDTEDLLDVLPHPNNLLDLGAGHGTFAAGIVQQVCPTADLRMYRAMDTDGVGREDAVAAAMAQAVSDGAEVLSLSLGTQTEDDGPPVAFRNVLEWIARTHPEVLVVAAAGNGGDGRPVWPAAFKQVTAVGALTADLTPAEWSSHGFWVDCSAVGEGIVSTFVPGRELAVMGGSVFGPDAWALWSGTSFTAPQIAGAVARLVQGNRSRGWTPRRALDELLDGGSWVPRYGAAVRLLPGTPRPIPTAV